MATETVSYALDLKVLADKLFPDAKPGHCIQCNELFQAEVNVFTEAGVRETQISGMCELCFDAMAEEADAEDGLNDELPF